MAKHWYKVDFHEGAKDRTMCGASDLDPSQLMQEVASAPFIRLDDLVYRDSQNRMHPWGNWDTRVKPTIFINSKYIVAVMEFVGDPTKSEPTAQ